jgi:hypothetical protein
MKNGRTQVPPSTAASISTSKPTTINSAAADGAVNEQLSIPIDDSRTLVIQIRMRLDVVGGSGPSNYTPGVATATPRPVDGAQTAWRRKRVVEVLRQLGYVPTALARWPRGLRRETKRQVLERLRAQDGSETWSVWSFNNVWQAARVAGQIADAPRIDGGSEVHS